MYGDKLKNLYSTFKKFMEFSPRRLVENFAWIPALQPLVFVEIPQSFRSRWCSSNYAARRSSHILLYAR